MKSFVEIVASVGKNDDDHSKEGNLCMKQRLQGILIGILIIGYAFWCGRTSCDLTNSLLLLLELHRVVLHP